MTFNELNIFAKFCFNRVSEDTFEEMMMPRYNDEMYIYKLWPSFRTEPMMFITSRNETELFDAICKKIEETNYKG